MNGHSPADEWADTINDNNKEDRSEQTNLTRLYSSIVSRSTIPVWPVWPVCPVWPCRYKAVPASSHLLNINQGTQPDRTSRCIDLTYTHILDCTINKLSGKLIHQLDRYLHPKAYINVT